MLRAHLVRIYSGENILPALSLFSRENILPSKIILTGEYSRVRGIYTRESIYSLYKIILGEDYTHVQRIFSDEYILAFSRIYSAENILRGTCLPRRRCSRLCQPPPQSPQCTHAPQHQPAHQSLTLCTVDAYATAITSPPLRHLVSSSSRLPPPERSASEVPLRPMEVPPEVSGRKLRN